VRATRSFVLGATLIASISLSSCTPIEPTTVPTISSRVEVDENAVALLPAKYVTNGILKVAIDPTYAPNESMDGRGNPVGWEVELGNALAAKLGLRMQFTNVSFTEILPSVKAGEYDLGLSSIFDTPARRKLVDMVDYYIAGTQWAQRKGGVTVDPNNACGLVVSVQAGTYQAEVDLVARNQKCLATGRQRIRVLTYTNQSDSIAALRLGHADAVVADSPVTQYEVQSSGGKLEAVFKPYDEQYYGLAIQKGGELAPALQLAMQSLINDGTYRNILAAWGVQQGAVPKALLNAGE
jgi:polar amino acid transport system substrate-binding protein